MAISKEQVEHVARLARLALSEQEKENLTLQLGNILEYIEKLKELDTSNVVPTAHPSQAVSGAVWREDQSVVSNDSQAILKNAPESEESFFKVKKVIE